MGNITNWTEGILISIMAVLLILIIAANFNVMYGQNNNLGSLGSKANSSEKLFVNYQTTTQDKISGSDVEFDASNGISLKSSYGIVTDAMNLIWGVLSGGWIEESIGFMNLGEAGSILGKGLRILYLFSLISALLYALFKVAV